MRKYFLDGNFLEKEITLHVRVPDNFDEEMESKIDEALADTLYNQGCELVDSKEYKDIGAPVLHPQLRNFGMENMRAMIREEIALNGASYYGMTNEEVAALQKNNGLIEELVLYMDGYMQRMDGNEYRALELVFEQNFCDVLDEFREERLDEMVDALQLFYDANINGSVLYVYCWWGESVEIFRADDGGLMCLLPDEYEPRALRDRIQDVKAGDAFLVGDGGTIRTTSDGAWKSTNLPGEPWCLIGDDNEVYYEHEIGTEIGQKMKELLEKLPEQEKKQASVGKVISEAAARSGEPVQRTDVDKLYD